MNTKMFSIAILLFIGVSARAQEEPAKDAGPRARITISHETTRITEPLDAKGNVDYIAAVNAIASQGVTPENNAAVVILQVFGPSIIEEEFRASYFKMLGIEPPEAKGEYWRNLHEFAAVSGFSSEEADQALEALYKPWTEAEQPLLAKWLAAHEKELDLAVQASKRSEFYSPLNSEDGFLVAAMQPLLQPTRDIVRCLVARAANHTAAADIDKAWEYLLACYRLGRLYGQGPTLVDGLLGIAIEEVASKALLELSNHSEISAEQANRILADLDKLPPATSMHERLENGERLIFLNCVCIFAEQGLQALAALVEGDAPTGLEKVFFRLASSQIDWNETLKQCNSWCDRMVLAARQKTFADRIASLDRVTNNLHNDLADARNLTEILKHILSSGSVGKAAGSQIGEILANLLLPSVNGVVVAEMRAKASLENIKTAIALAAWRTEKKSYPENLTELVPKYLPAVPTDPFSEKPLIYRRQEDGGYLLYSVGKNLKDDMGRNHFENEDEELDGDDHAIRAPAPTR